MLRGGRGNCSYSNFTKILVLEKEFLPLQKKLTMSSALEYSAKMYFLL